MILKGCENSIKIILALKYKPFLFLKKSLYFFLLLIQVFLFAQQKKFILQDAQTQKLYIKYDSLSAIKFLDSLVENHYYMTQILQIEKKENTTNIIFDKGKNYNIAKVKLSSDVQKKISFPAEILTKNLDSLKKEILQRYIDLGFSFARIKTSLTVLKNEVPEIQLYVFEGDSRNINGFVIKGYDWVPKRFIKNLENQFKNKKYAPKTLLHVQNILQSHPFVSLEKPPQTFFTKDSTQVFLFLQKKKTNSFDGMIGFGNNNSEKFTINGTLNLQLKNVLNGFESMSIFWQNNPDSGQTFNLFFDIPYTLQSNIGTQINLNIFRQDSTFANVKVMPALYYHINNFQKLGVKGVFETSTILDSQYNLGRDFSKNGFGFWYDFTESLEISLFVYRTILKVGVDYLTINYPTDQSTAKQFNLYAFLERNLNLFNNHWLNLKAETNVINTKNSLTNNELIRFGGWNSFRGFNENSLLANKYYFGSAEYRYLVNNSAFFDVFFQYGKLQNKSLNIRPSLYSIGLGFNFTLPIGVMSFQISNGSSSENKTRFRDTKIHWGIVSRF